MVIPWEDLCFSVVPFDSGLTSENQERFAYAVAYMFKPVCNKGPKTLTAPIIRTQIECEGDIAYLNSSITIPF